MGREESQSLELVEGVEDDEKEGANKNVRLRVWEDRRCRSLIIARGKYSILQGDICLFSFAESVNILLLGGSVQNSLKSHGSLD